MKAVITAGGRVDADYARAAGTDVKALAPVRGQTMIARAIEALRGAGVTRIAIVGGDEVATACAALVERIVPEGASGSDNVLRALQAWPDDDGEALLYATSDMPYVTADAVSDFVARVPAGRIALALSEYDDFAARFPDTTGFGITLHGERVVNGGLFSLPAGSCARVASLATRLFEARKQPWRMATLVSPVLVARLAVGRLGIAHIEDLAQKLVGVPAAGVRRCAPELAYDADTATEYAYACRQS